MSFEIKEIVESAGTNLPNLFDFSSFGVFWKEGPSLLPLSGRILPSFLHPRGDEEHDQRFFGPGRGANRCRSDRPSRLIKRKLRPKQRMVSPKATLKSHLTLPLAVEGEIFGCISLNSEQPNAFDAQDLQFLSVIGYQMAASLKHFQRFSSVKTWPSMIR